MLKKLEAARLEKQGLKDPTLLSSDFSIKLTRIFFSMNRKCKFHQRNFSTSVKRPPTLGAAFSWKLYQVQRIFKNGRNKKIAQYSQIFLIENKEVWEYTRMHCKHRRRCFFLQNCWPISPILFILSRIYALFGILLHA